jgi:hypothetical protein
LSASPRAKNTGFPAVSSSGASGALTPLKPPPTPRYDDEVTPEQYAALRRFSSQFSGPAEDPLSQT